MLTVFSYESIIYRAAYFFYWIQSNGRDIITWQKRVSVDAAQNTIADIYFFFYEAICWFRFSLFFEFRFSVSWMNLIKQFVVTKRNTVSIHFKWNKIWFNNECTLKIYFVQILNYIKKIHKIDKNQTKPSHRSEWQKQQQYLSESSLHCVI